MRVKRSKQPPPAPTASAIGPCPTLIQIVGRPGTESLPSTFAPPDHPRGFKISTLKTKAIIFSRRKINIGSLQKLTLFGRDIEFSDQITFLGMTLDKKLTWGEHIKKMIEKYNKDLNLMRLTYQVPHMGRIRKSFSPSIRH